jgi:hypothetical protein
VFVALAVTAMVYGVLCPMDRSVEKVVR